MLPHKVLHTYVYTYALYIHIHYMHVCMYPCIYLRIYVHMHLLCYTVQMINDHYHHNTCNNMYFLLLLRELVFHIILQASEELCSLYSNITRGNLSIVVQL